MDINLIDVKVSASAYCEQFSTFQLATSIIIRRMYFDVFLAIHVSLLFLYWLFSVCQMSFEVFLFRQSVFYFLHNPPHPHIFMRSRH